MVVRFAAEDAPFCAADCGELFVNGSYYGEDDGRRVCVERCASGYVLDSECVSGCERFWEPADARGHRVCREACPGNHTGEGMCVSACPADYYYLRAESACYKACPEGYVDDGETGTCELLVCPAEKPFRERDGTCQASCSSKLFKVRVENGAEVKTCILRCSFYTVRQTFGDVQMSLCAEDFSCPDREARLLDVASGKCVSRCPENAFLLEETRACVDSCPYAYYR